MGLLNKVGDRLSIGRVREQVGKAVDQHGDKIAAGMDKAGEAIDRRTGGKHKSKIDGGLSKAKSALDKLDGKDDDIPPRPAP